MVRPDMRRISLYRWNILLLGVLLCHSIRVLVAFSPKSLSKAPSVGNAATDDLLQRQEPASINRRRALMSQIAVILTSGAIATPVAFADTGAEVRGTPVNAFNGLIFNYRGNEFAGLQAADLNEPSISYADFVSKLKAGEVSFVEFLAPDGDVAYATLGNEKKIRIGEGYPIEQHDGYSSPAFCIRTVKNAGIPYKFVVPALSKAR